ncbi:GMC family oxidoreductase N-terminal domain-containing protein [Streptosporangium sp. NPDC051023]|uniref:GMC family oxidoreductase N-terminal domain-containing protein n=1 Tax=Streptosporangium sp. NPDC051023 TaxID=3155410 RepID=UPI00344C5B00
MRAFMRRSAGDLGVPWEIEALLPTVLSAGQLAGAQRFLDGLTRRAFHEQSLPQRARTLALAWDRGPDVKRRLQQVKILTLLLFYALTDETGRNPNWPAIGYPGPVTRPPTAARAPKTIATLSASNLPATLDVDVCVVGSGPGGAVVAARCAQAGLSVIVLEAGGYHNEQDFRQLELAGLRQLYLGGGLMTSESGSIAVLAGSTLGGGSVSNYMSCIRTPDAIREEWARLGVADIGADDFPARHLDPVCERLAINVEATRANGTHKRLRDGLDALGLEHRVITRNAELHDDARYCGYCGFGCQQGLKLSMLKTYLQDASDAGARTIVNCWARGVLSAGGRARGIEAVLADGDGSRRRLIVNARAVVVAAGAVESPALLLRSGVGGPAVGRYLRVQPAFSVAGVYDEPVQAWIGQAQSLVCESFRDVVDGHGFLIEGLGVFPGFWAAGVGWEDGRRHKEEMLRLPRTASFVSFIRDHGAGEVVIDERGRSVVRWDLDDPVDRELAVRAHIETARVHAAAGAAEIYTLHGKPARWRRGEDFEAYAERLRAASYGTNDILYFTAHQMGTCRMGTDPLTSVADGRGELHDLPGAWIGDGSAFPTAPGVNPMITIMALAHRTSDHLLESLS